MFKSKLSAQIIEAGMTVEINPQSDSSRNILVQGIVSEILTKSKNHPHGILVKLKTGEIGRAKRIINAPQSAMPIVGSPSSINKIHFSKLIELGENHEVEFKSSILWSSAFTSDDIKNHKPQSKELHAYGKATSKIIIAKTLAAFLNSDGGTLIVGIRENKADNVDEIIGIDIEFKFLKDGSQDGYRRMIVDLIKDHFPSNVFNHLNSYFHIDFQKIGNLTICGINVVKSDKRVFLKLKNIDHFFIRTDASTRELTGEDIVDYCQNRFIGSA
jgi:uncharacterized repeat protein (TIGR03833 family)